MLRSFATGMVVVLVALLSPAFASAQSAVSGQFLVGYERGQSPETLAERAGGRLMGRLGGIRAARVRGGGAFVRRLRELPGVRYVEPDHILEATSTPDDPLFPQQYGLNQPSGNDISAEEAWNVRTTCTKMAVLDSGAQTNHPDLADNLRRNTGEVPDNNRDDDKNGYVDDAIGWDAYDGKGSGDDQNGHGTHVSGIVGGRGNNDNGVSGVCWGASVIPVRFMSPRGKGSTSDAIDGMHYAIRAGAKIINCSFGTSSKSESLEDQIDYAKSKGVLLVVAAGNDSENIDSQPSYPASYTYGNILTVAATTAQDQLASFSNFGAIDVDLAAPGDQILSTYPTSTYKRLSGTSMASPYVAGAAAMLKARRSSATYKDLKSALVGTVDQRPGLAGKVKSGGRLNLNAALAAIG